jgi:serine/threonine-protein kinase
MGHAAGGGGGVLSRLVAIEGDARRLDRFELVAELATGGMATVYLARLSGVGGFQRFVAIKRLHPHLAREPEFIEMFLEEARLAARIHHPNVVPIAEIGTSEDGYYLVMEYVEGDTLGRLLARAAQSGQRLPIKVGLRIMIDTLAGLDAAHELTDDDGQPLGIVHRDVSPQNILVGVDGSSRLTDFGVARATSRLSTTRAGQLKGKLAYMAPEQARGHKDIDRRADVFAAGIVLWEVMTCRRLFKGDGEADTLSRVLGEPIPPVRTAAPTVPAALEAVVAKALERDRARRFASAADFADALERAARVVAALGTHKDVAAYLDAVLGSEIGQQREAVRAWLARSEPNKRSSGPTRAASSPDSSGMHATAAPRLEVTRVEGRAGTDVPSVPSVASAVISTHPGPKSAPAAAASLPGGVPAYARRRVWVGAGAIAAILVAGMAWMRWTGPQGRPAAQPAALAPPPSIAPLVASSVPAPPAPPPAPATIDAATAQSVPTPPPPRRGPAGRPRPARPQATPPPSAPPAPSASPPAAPVPDDISRNPYR